LRHNEWYQDFMRPSGIADVAAVQLCQVGTHRVLLGLQYDKAGAASAVNDAKLRQLLPHVQKAARIRSEHDWSNVNAAVFNWTLEHLHEPFFITSRSARVIAMNTAAERMLGSSKTLTLRHGRLGVSDSSEAERLLALLSSEHSAATADRRPTSMLITKPDSRSRQFVTVFPLGNDAQRSHPELFGIRVVALADGPFVGEESNLMQLFGLSPAELRLAQGLMRGRTLRELTAEFGVHMPTLRTQLSSILHKCGVRRQSDLIRLLLRVRW
jgi:DNA-binding CsgD family transcriptional regulator